MELETKWRGYYEVSSQSSILYKIVQRIALLEPYYEAPLKFFEDQFKMTLADCKRLKAESGASNARVAEITSQFTLDLYKRICINFFKGAYSFASCCMKVTSKPISRFDKHLQSTHMIL